MPVAIAGDAQPHRRKPPRRLAEKIVPIDDLKGWDKNPRDNDRAAEKLAQTFKAHGFIDAVTATPDLVVRAGNTRLKAAKLAGITRIPVVVVEFECEADAIAYALADNRAGEWASWNEDRLAEIMTGDLSDVDMDAVEGLTGFTQDEIEGIKEGWTGNDAEAEWRGMPEYEHDDKTSLRQIVVHFKSHEDAAEFGRRVGQTVTEKTRSLWFPPDEVGTIADKRYGE